MAPSEPSCATSCNTKYSYEESYRWLEDIGRGFNGEVFKAESIRDCSCPPLVIGSVVAVKWLPRRSVGTWQDVSVQTL